MKMNKIIIVVVIIAVILLGILFYKYIHHKENLNEIIYGGEGPGVVELNKSKINSTSIEFSEIVLSETLSRINKSGDVEYNIRDLSRFGGLVLGKLKDTSSIKIYGNNYLVKTSIYPRYFSDGLLDGMNVLLHNKNIKSVICQSEFPTNVYGNEIEIFSTKLEKHFDESVKRIYSISRINNDIIIYKDFKRNPAFKSLGGKDISKHKFVFLEFSYNDFSDNYKIYIPRIFNEIHTETLKILNHILSDTSNTQIYVLRYSLEGDKYDERKFNIHIETDLKTIYGGKMKYYISSTFDTINIPPTQFSLDMDEFLLINKDDLFYHVQIEHSENEDRHKSNIIESLMRNWKLLGWKNGDLHRIISNTLGYKNINYMSDVDDKTNLAFRIANTEYFDAYIA